MYAMIIDSDNIPQYIPIIGGGDLRGFGGSMLGIGALTILKGMDPTDTTIN